jgi:hypothetical protein
MKSQYTKEDLKNMIPVFHLKPETSTRVKSTLTMYVSHEERLMDDQLDIETPQDIKEKIGENTLLLGQVNNYVIIGKYCACNIPGEYLIKNTKIPVYYLSIIFNRQFVTGCLFNVFLYFDIDEDTKKRLDKPNKYYKAFMDGKYTVQFVPADENFLEKIREFVERDILLKYQKELDKCSNLEDKDIIMEKVILEIENEMKAYEKFLEPQDFENNEVGKKAPREKIAFKRLNAFCDSHIFKKLVSYGLMYREDERIKAKDIDESIYKIPQNIINFNEIKNNPQKLAEMLNKKKVDIDSDDERC